MHNRLSELSSPLHPFSRKIVVSAFHLHGPSPPYCLFSFLVAYSDGGNVVTFRGQLPEIRNTIDINEITGVSNYSRPVPCGT